MAGVGRRRRGKSQDDATFFRVLRGEVVVGGGVGVVGKVHHVLVTPPLSCSLLHHF